MRSANSIGSRPRSVSPGETTGVFLGAHADLYKGVSHDAVGLNGRHRVRTHQLPQVLAEPHANAKSIRRSGRHLNLEDLARIEPGQPHRSARPESGDLAECRVQLELPGEEQPSIADEKQAAAKEQEPTMTNAPTSAARIRVMIHPPSGSSRASATPLPPTA